MWVERREERQHSLVSTNVHVDTRLTQGAQSQEHEGNTEEEVTHHSVTLAIDEDDGDEESGIDEVGDVERETCRHDPRRECRTDVGTHDDGNGLCKR